MYNILIWYRLLLTFSLSPNFVLRLEPCNIFLYRAGHTGDIWAHTQHLGTQAISGYTRDIWAHTRHLGTHATSRHTCDIWAHTRLATTIATNWLRFLAKTTVTCNLTTITIVPKLHFDFEGQICFVFERVTEALIWRHIVVLLQCQDADCCKIITMLHAQLYIFRLGVVGFITHAHFLVFFSL